MDKVLRNSIIAGILITSLSIGYYLVIFLPNKEKIRIEQQKIEKEEEEEKKREQSERELQEVTERCLRDAKVFHEKYKKEQEESSMTDVLDPQYFYNKKMGRCLYSGGHNIFANEIYHHRVIKDVYTNETIISLSPTIINGKPVIEKEDSDKFLKAHNLVMSSQ